jgi:hypothetical protein
MKYFKKHGKKVSLFVLVSLLLVFAFSNLALAATEEANFKVLNVSIKPEFDKEKTTLIMYEGELAEDTKLPSKVSYYAPKEIIDDETLQFCALSAKGDHLCQVREKTAEGIYLKYSGPMPEVKTMFEGYVPNIKDEGGKKSVDYTFKAAQDIKELNIAVVEPKGASDYKIDPASSATAKDNDGLNNSIYTFKDVKKGKEYNYKISYVKQGWGVSVVKQENADPNAPTSGSTGLSIWAIFGAILGAGVVAAGILFAFIKMGQGGGGGGRPTPVAPKGKARFCVNCGSRLTGQDKFCPSCGSKLK